MFSKSTSVQQHEAYFSAETSTFVDSETDAAIQVHSRVLHLLLVIAETLGRLYERDNAPLIFHIQKSCFTVY